MTEPLDRSTGESHPALLKPAGQNLGLSPPRGGAGPRRGMFSSLKHRAFRRYWVGLFFSNIGSWMQAVAQGWLVLRLSDSALVLGLVTFAGSLPTLVLAPFAGVAADRYDRRAILLATQSVQMAAALLLAAATFWGFATVPLVAALAIASGVANAYTTPSHQSLFLDLVGPEDLLNAISLNSMQFNLSRVVGPMIAGFTIAIFGEPGCFLLNAVSFVAILVPLALLPAMRPAPRPSRGAWADLLIGLRFARQDRLLPPLLAICMGLAVFGTPAVTLAPLYARRLLDVGPKGLGGMLSAVGVGAVVTALLIAWLEDFKNKGLAITVASSAFALSLAGLALSRRYALALAFLALLGGAMMSSSSLINTLMQKRAPFILRGRVISLYALAWSGFVPLGNLQAGAVAENFGAAASLWVGAAGIAATLLAVRVFQPIPPDAS
ncbi:MAG TPA: MFS transporter [Thermoanaerobaculia bacterium]